MDSVIHEPFMSLGPSEAAWALTGQPGPTAELLGPTAELPGPLVDLPGLSSGCTP